MKGVLTAKDDIVVELVPLNFIESTNFLQDKQFPNQ